MITITVSVDDAEELDGALRVLRGCFPFRGIDADEDQKGFEEKLVEALGKYQEMEQGC